MKKNILLMTDQLRVGGGEKYFFKIENNINTKKFNLFTAAEDGESRNMIRDKSKLTILPKNKLKSIFTIKKIINENNIDLIHANSLTISMLSYWARFISKRNPKIIYTKHNLTFLERVGDKLFAFYVNHFVFKMLTVCDLDKKNMINKGVKEEKIISIPNGTDTNEFPFNSSYLNKKNNKLKVGILARLDPVKNHNLFIDILNEFNNENENKVEGFIAGDGELREEIEKKIKDLNVDIKMLGNLENPKEFLTNIDILMLTSTREVFPMTILEGLSVGAIVIASNVGGVSDVIKNNETGYLINNHSISDFKDAISSVQNLREKNNEIILNGRKIIEDRYSNKIMMRSLENLYMEE